MQWYLEVLKKYAVFSGRARRKEYWYFVLFNFLASFVLVFIESAVGGAGILSGLYALAVLIPGLAVSIRRLHDTDRSGWWVLIMLIPLIGAIVFIVFAAQEGTAGDNEYGSNPIETEA